MSDLQHYRYGGARALVILHERQMRRFFAVWQQAKAMGVTLPKGDDPSYASMERLLWHVLRAAASYMTWMCEVLELPDPEIRAAPALETLEREAESYLDHLIERWRAPLAGVSEDECYSPEYTSGWDTRYCIDAMLEHAVMHPVRHRFQLEELMSSS